MASKQVFQKLKQSQVYLDGCISSEYDLELVCRSSCRLQELVLKNNKITSKQMIHFSNKKWNFLTYLCLSNNLIGAKGCKYITQANMKNLKIIQMSKNSIGNEGILHLSKGYWKNLIYIYVENTQIRQSGIDYLVRGNWLKLQIIWIGQCDRQNWFYNLNVMQVQSLLLSEFKNIKQLRIECQNCYQCEVDRWIFREKFQEAIKCDG